MILIGIAYLSVRSMPAAVGGRCMSHYLPVGAFDAMQTLGFPLLRCVIIPGGYDISGL